MRAGLATKIVDPKQTQKFAQSGLFPGKPNFVGIAFWTSKRHEFSHFNNTTALRRICKYGKSMIAAEPD